MSIGQAPRRRGAALLTLLAVLGLGASAAQAAVPGLGASWAGEVSATSARLHSFVSPNGLPTTYHFNYITTAAYEANLGAGKDGFSGAAKAPPGTDGSIGPNFAVAVVQPLAGLASDTAYRYRLIAENGSGSEKGPTLSFRTQALGVPLLLDNRGWEMVSPLDKSGGQVDPPGTLAGGGVLQAGAGGGAITYSSAASFGQGAQGAPFASQYIARRGAGAWSTENITAPLFSGSYANSPEGVPYRLFSEDLARGLLLNGDRCRGEGEACAVANPPLPGSDAPAGYQNFYLRDSATASFEALLGASTLNDLVLGPAQFEARFAAATPDLGQIVLASCAALTPDATEALSGEGCDPAKANLYRYSAGAISLINVLPADSQGTPGAALAAQSRAISADGSRVYWGDLEGNLYLREGTQSKQLATGATFETASRDGSTAFYTKAQHLYRYSAVPGTSVDLTPAGKVLGVLGASEDGTYVYYLTDSGLFLRHGAATTKVADAGDEANFPPTTGVARVSADGTRLLFVSTDSLTDYDNADAVSGVRDRQVYLYDAVSAPALTCVSCNPTEGRPIGPSGLTGATPNGKGSEAPHSYKPRALSADGRRVFFESGDSLVSADTNVAPDVYQWEAQGVGSCARSGGCTSLISSGKTQGGASFVDASADGSDVFFLTEGSLVSEDPGSIDLYDARVGGGFPVAQTPIPCEGDACQSLPSEPTDPALNTLLSGPGNSAVRYLHHQGHSGHRKHHHKGHKGKKRHHGDKRRPGGGR